MVGIYKITSPSGKVYIGQSVDIFSRISKYRAVNCSEQTKLYRSLLKYGWKQHVFEVIEECDIDQLNDRERYWQDFYDVLKSGLNCKLTKSSDRSGVSSQETKDKISKNNPKSFLGRKHSDESKLKISIALKGKKSRLGAVLSEETKLKIAKKATGRKHSEETKLKMSNDRLGVKRVYSDNSFYKVIDVDSGVIYKSAKECATVNNLKLSTLRNKLCGIRRNNTNFIYLKDHGIKVPK